MTQPNSNPDFARLIDLTVGHSLTISRTHLEKRSSTHYETHWLEERDQQGILIARIRSWTNRGTKPPYRVQIGWERYSLSGELLTREIRYSKRPTDDYLH